MKDCCAFHTNSVHRKLKIEFLKLVDVAIQQLNDRTIIACPDLRYCEHKAMLLSGTVNEGAESKHG